MQSSKPSSLLVALAGFLITAGIVPASARGGGSNLLISPGYQRALEESRKRQAEPYLNPSTGYPRKTWRKRGRR